MINIVPQKIDMFLFLYGRVSYLNCLWSDKKQNTNNNSASDIQIW